MPRRPGMNRRQLLSAGVVLGSAFAIDDTQARSISGQVPWQPDEANKPPPVAEPAPGHFFTPDEGNFIDAAVARLIPKDELGPGAKEAGVTTFLDRQLAGPYGKGSDWYMQGPWEHGTKTQGYQSRRKPAELYRAAISAIDDYCSDQYSGRKFAALTGDEQDKVLKGVEGGDITLKGVDGKTFFTMFLQNTTEGFFSDPIYGGNRDMAGWKLIGFPGVRYDYRPYVKKHNQKLGLAPVGIKGRPKWTPS
jgi:gluconate 2-dehydrogenase gamma chain